MKVKVAPPFIQCPECGVPIEALEAHGRDGTVHLDPCGHDVRADAFGTF